MRVADEVGARRPDEEDLLEEVKGDVRGGEELAGVGGGETDMGDGVVGEVMGAEREIFSLGQRTSAWCRAILG